MRQILELYALRLGQVTYIALVMKLSFPVGIEIETSQSSDLNNRMLPHEYELGTDHTAGWEARSIKFETAEPLVESTANCCRIMRNAGCRIHHKCGLHVHIGFKQIGDLSAKYRLFRFISCYEEVFFELLPPWPERAEYCVRLRPATWKSFQQGQGFNYWLDKEAAQSGDTARSSRYWWFNGASMFKHGTVEFRLMNGTLDHNEILGWVAVLQCMFHATTNLNIKLDWRNTRMTPKTLLRDMHTKENEFWGRRASNFVLEKSEQHVAPTRF
jgi:hypothetical protein